MNCILLPENFQTNLKICNANQVTHIKTVLKATIGDRISIGEMNGNIGTAVIQEIHDTEIILTDVLLDRLPPPKLEVTVVLALPRPKVMRRLVMDMTALGVNRIILVNSYRSQKSYWQSPLLKRLDEFVLEGLQQAVDTVPPIIEFKKRLKPYVEDELSLLLTNNAGLVAHPYATLSFKELLSKQSSLNQSMPKFLCIGAEGGWIDYEVDLFCKSGCQAVSLGSRILRTEAAVNVLLGSWLS